MEEVLDRALEKRAGWLTRDTDCLRLLDGAGDGVPGVLLEAFAGRWLVSTGGSTLEDRLASWLAASGRTCYWKRLDQHQKESPAHLSGPVVDGPFLIRENGLVFEVSFQSGYSQGIFLDQRDNREELRGWVRPGMRVLNTFAYTGAFSVAAAMGGAETTTLDLSQPYLDWAKRNFSHNRLDPAAHHFCKGDTFHWLRRFAKQGRRFDAVLLDPPTFSRDEKGRVFRAEQDFGGLAALAVAVLAPGGRILCCCNFRGISAAEFERRVQAQLPRPMMASHRQMPPDFTGPAYLKSMWLE
jgi:23S rRNA (cytosine1962-C5)-methyltransferase